MAIAERISAVGRACAFAVTLTRVSPADRKLIEQALSTGEVTPYQLEGILRAEGYTASRETIKHHVNGVCACRSKTN